MSEEEKYYCDVGATPYDDVFRTLVTECSQLVIPILNEAFGEKYTGNEKIEFRPNEHYLRQQDGHEQKRITDSSFRVIGSESKSYLLECQSTADSSMLIRIFEYVTQIALDESSCIENKLILDIPNAAILFLRSTKNTPDQMSIVMNYPGGVAEFDVPCLKIESYTVKDIFEKKLYFLIPFYLFTYESHFKEIENDKEKLKSVMNEYRYICTQLNEALNESLLTVFVRNTVKEMSDRVIEALAKKYSNIKKGVKSVMGGMVIEHEAKKILDEGISIGRSEGISIGRSEGISIGKSELISSMIQNGMTDEQLKQFLQLSDEEIAQARKCS